ncbi:MAG TPA: WecB/TagA/CpsF family glycosyltransferase [Bacteroidales bacterium]|nr:WecB/TagA/CpsF family glycosyltransferase [Bacteroidales bacterium]
MKVDFLGIPVDSHTMEETISRIDEAIKADEHINHVVINAGKVVSMMKDRELFNSVLSCDIISADGQSIVWAARILGKKIPGRVAGVDLMQELIKLASVRGYKCFFLGAREEVVKKVVERYTKEYGPGIIAGYRNGYFSSEEESEVAMQIAGSGANMLFVAITSPKKEKFLYKYESVLRKVNFTMGVGGTFDIIAGLTKRAPKWVQNMGMEWFVRLAQEPGRMWKRYLVGNTTFIYLVMRERIRFRRRNNNSGANNDDN